MHMPLIPKRLIHESQSRVHLVPACIIAAYVLLNMDRERNYSRLAYEMRMDSLSDQVDVVLSIGMKTKEHYSRAVTVLTTRLLKDP